MITNTGFKGTVLATGVLLAAVPTVAAAPVRAREREQRHRIVHGVQTGALTGALTPREAHRLWRRENRLRRRPRRARMSGGHMTGQERAHLERQANRQSRCIYRQAHDAQHR